MKRIAVIATALLLAFNLATSPAAAEDSLENLPLEGLEKIESIVYGTPGAGGLLLRLSKIERDLFGMELPGSMTERQAALVNFVEKGASGQPSLLFKVAVAEWVTLRRVNSSTALAERISALEETLEGETQVGALSARLERLITKLMPNGVSSTNVTAPANTVFRAKFVSTLTVRTVAKGDVVALELTEDCIIGGALAAARGNRLFAEVTRVKMPRSFGRPSEIDLEFKSVEFLDATTTPVFIGPEAQKAADIDKATIGAAGASIAATVLIGPVGLATGFLVRGSDRQIKEGTGVFVESHEAAVVMAYAAPEAMIRQSIDSDAASPSGGETSGVITE
ncbi:MAG: hypothetical protein LBT31_00125 [Synergistaceae bacterium]|jgi:hypothetical protein|nr:hypothetical protein [Synergistaceae bacterium]